MTLAERIKLVDDMVKENRDVTIKDYLELVKELQRIRSSRIFFDRQSRQRYSELRREFIRT